MKTETKKALLRTLYIVLIVLFVAFIFSNSLESREVSASKSSGIVERVNTTLKKINSPILVKEVFVRKSAHFIEFFILGLLLFGYTFFFGKLSLTNAFYSCFLACMVAMTDETIQYFSSRGSMLLDVWLDFLAASLAILLFYTIYIYGKRANNK